MTFRPRLPENIPCRDAPDAWADTCRREADFAIALCAACIAQDRCADAAAALTDEDKAGQVWAGIYYPPRPHTTTTTETELVPGWETAR